MLSDCIPADIWAETVLELLDVRDMAALETAFGPDAIFDAMMDFEVANAAAKAARATADAAIKAAEAAEETAMELATKARLVEANTPSTWLSATLPARSAYRPKRTLNEMEAVWFATHAIPVAFQTECITVEFEDRFEARNRLGTCTLARIIDYCSGHRDKYPVRAWYVKGSNRLLLLHRNGDLPAVECANGDRYWCFYDIKHRDGNLPATELACGNRYWVHMGVAHRDNDLPSVELTDGYRGWWVHGVRHREGGLPAVIHADGKCEWWVHGVRQQREGAS